MTSNIPYGRQYISDEDISAVVNALRSDFLTQGPEILKFEESFAKYSGSNYAVAVSNGTAALHVSCMALGLKKGQKVITSPITFAASANCVLYCGAEIDFVDIDPDTYLLDINKIKEKIGNSPEGTYAGIIPVDFAGYPVNTEELRKIANEHKLWIIEDACHSPGGFFMDSKKDAVVCGSGNYSDLTCFSFHPVKHIACGEGGMITTNNKDLYAKLLSLRTHGIIKNADLMQENHGAWYYEMQELGYNYRLTDFQAALGNSQLKKADQGLKRRREIASIYYNAFKDKSFIKGQSGIVEGHAYHLYIIEIEKRKELYDYLKSKNIFCQVHYIPVHLLPYYKNKGWKLGDFPFAEKYYERCLSLPIFASLNEEDQDFVIETVKEFYK